MNIRLARGRKGIAISEAYVLDDQTTEPDLDILGVFEGTDKSSSVALAWDYLRHYQDVFAGWRHQAINLIEIGVDSGSSLNLWLKYFSRARIVGIDINPACARPPGDRIVVEIGSQDDPAFLHSTCAKYPPSIIIDDGSHFAHHIVYSFQRLFPMLLDGGIYIVEDVELHFAKWGGQWAGDKTVSVPGYLLEIARARMGNDPAANAPAGDDRYIWEHVDKVSFVGGAIFIHKKKARDIEAALAFAEHHLASEHPVAANYIRLAVYILRHAGDLGQAEQYVRHAIEIGDQNGGAFEILIEVLRRQGRLDAARSAACQATELWPGDPGTWARRGNIDHLSGHVGDAIANFEFALSLKPEEPRFLEQLSYLYQEHGNLGRALSLAQRVTQLRPGHEPDRRRVTELGRLTGTM
jgi:tetratricopeptide (TPR) repeat protein